MSERGSFVTQYIYCDKCFQAAKTVLLARDKGLCSTVIPQWDTSGEEMPIIAGKLGASWGGGEIHAMETELGEDLEKVICCPLRVAVLAESGEEIFTFKPGGGSERIIDDLRSQLSDCEHSLDISIDGD